MEAIWVAAEMRAGGAYAHSALALDTIARDKAEKASDPEGRRSSERTLNKRRECGMSTKVAINGLGRIGRAILKLVIESRRSSWSRSTTWSTSKTSPTCFASTRCTGGTQSPW